MKKRIVSIEILRILAMIMVVTLHFLDKGGYLPEPGDVYGFRGSLAWLMECGSVVAVNVYVLISAYFMTESKFRTGRLIDLWLQGLFYSLGISVIMIAMGWVSVSEWDTHDKLMLLLPVTMEHYWFLSAYVVMFLVAPFLNAAVHHMTRKQHGTLLLLLIFLFSGIKSVLPVQIELPGQGYDARWFLVLYLLGAYIRLYGLSFFEKRSRAVAGYFFAVAAVYTETMALRRFFVNTGRLERITTIALDYNHLFTLSGAVCLFMAFLPRNAEIKESRGGKTVCALSPLTFGVYLLHEHILLRTGWPAMLHVTGAKSPGGMLLNWIITLVILFGAGMATDYIRTLIFKGGKHLLRNSFLTKQIAKIDAAVNSLGETGAAESK